MADSVLYIKRRGADGVEELFPSESAPVMLSAYTYTAKRMGGAPTITDSFSYDRCLDKEWTREEYVTYDGEDYYLSAIPSASIDNTTGRYKHEVTFVSRRAVLDNTLFFDVVTADAESQDGDKYRSNLPKFTFGGDIYEFVKRINSSLSYCGLYDATAATEAAKGYYVVVDEGYGSDAVKELSFENKYITEVLQEIYNTYELSYYWVGKVCHIGDAQNDMTEDASYTVRYGRNDALLSLSNENSNAQVVDTVTGYGSSDNIPYYYPNEDEYGAALFDVKNVGKEAVTVQLSGLWKWNNDCYDKAIHLCKVKGDTADVRLALDYADVQVAISKEDSEYDYGTCNYDENGGFTTIERKYAWSKEDGADGATYYTCREDKIAFSMRVKGAFNSVIDLSGFEVVCVLSAINGDKSGEGGKTLVTEEAYIDSITLTSVDVNDKVTILKKDRYSATVPYTFVQDEVYVITVVMGIKFRVEVSRFGEFDPKGTTSARFDVTFGGAITYKYVPRSARYMRCGELSVDYESSGITFKDIDNTPAESGKMTFGGKNRWWYLEPLSGEADAATVTVTGRTWIDPTGVLMPSIYRNSDGAERFYYARNNEHKKPDGSGDYYVFKNLYKKGNPHQGVATFDDIKPTINGIRNDVLGEDGKGELFGEVADVAFDALDSDIKDSSDNYIHPYFYIKLHKFSGEFGFSLFEHALASESAKIEMTDCQGCPACSFTIMCVWDSGKNRCYNPVSTDDSGNLQSLRTEKEDYILDDTKAQTTKLNQDTRTCEVWIAVQKDASTLGVVMPNASQGFKVKKGDKFVITGIRPPKILITAAEKRLDEALIQYMSENNEDQFSKTIKFSRIFLAENTVFASLLNENAKINVEHNGDVYPMYVSDYTVKRDGNILSDVSVELSKSLEVTQSDIKREIESVKGETVRSLSSLLTTDSGFNATIANKMYLSKINADTAQALIKFLKGLVVGDGSSGIDSVGVATLRQVLSREYADAVGEGMLGEGFFMGQKKDVDGNGYSYLEVDKLLVRKVAEFIKLVIREVKSVGGTLVLSPAAMECVLVEARLNNGSIVGITDSADFYRCYFREEEDGKEISNEFSVGDLARCQTFNVKSGTRYYWRRVVAVGDDYIDLSATDYDKTVKNDVPAVGDEIVVMGNATDTDRQAVIVLSAYGADAPSIALYRGVDSYTMSGKAVVVLSKKEVYILADRLYYRASDGTQTSVANAISKTEEEIKAQGDDLSNTKGELTKVTSRVATLEVTSEGITTRVSKTEEEIKAQGDEIRQFDTKIEQTAEEIALEVAETVTSQTNLLRGTAFDATSEGCIISGTRMDGKGYKGANAVLAVNETADALQGVRWVGGSKQGNISLTKGKTYTLTFWTMSTGTNGTVRADVIWQGYATDTSRPAGMTGPAGSGSVINDACKRSVWQMHTATFTVAADAPYSYVEIFLFNRTTDDKTVGTFFSRPMLAEGERYSGWALADGEKTALEANILATGIDIKSHKITATTDSFVIRNNSGKTTAEVNADGVLHTTDAVIEGTVKAKDGYFSGFIRKQPCVITPDTLDSYGATDTTTGYVTIDFTKAGTLVSINGDMKTKLGRSELALVLPYGGTGDSDGLNALCYIDQKIVVLNTSNVTVGIVSKAVGTVSPSGTATIDAGQMMVIEPVVTLSVGAGVTNTTYAVKWNVKRAKL